MWSTLKLAAPAAGETQGPDSGEKGLDAPPASVNRYAEGQVEVHFPKYVHLQRQPLIKSKRHGIADYQFLKIGMSRIQQEIVLCGHQRAGYS